jgi:hypothetical protein
MTAMKNAVHLGVLTIWATLGAMLTFNLVFGSMALVAPLAFWLWFAGFAAVTTAVVRKFEGPIAALGIHAAAFGLLHLVPKVVPFHLLRLGLDMLSNR